MNVLICSWPETKSKIQCDQIDKVIGVLNGHFIYLQQGNLLANSRKLRHRFTESTPKLIYTFQNVPNNSSPTIDSMFCGKS